MIKELLEQEGAVGAENALTSQCIMEIAHIKNERSLIAIVANERDGGALICCKQGGKGGYYMPASDAEILEQKARFEKGFASRARAVRPFRKWAKEHKGSNGYRFPFR